MVPEVSQNQYGFGPRALVFVVTSGCTARCRDCCFGATPEKARERLRCEEMLRALEVVYGMVPTLKLVVFTGGEPMLFARDIVPVVAEASRLGLGTRIVTNGFWAQTPALARQVLEPLYAAGLLELNLSTGDDHLEWVPFESVVNAALAALEAGVLTAVFVEERADARFRAADVFRHPLIRRFLRHHPNHHLLIVNGGAWLGLRTGRQFAAEVGSVPDGLGGPPLGCDSIGRDLVVAPGNRFFGCCGLTVRDIPWLQRHWRKPEELLDHWACLNNEPLAFVLRQRGPEFLCDVLGIPLTDHEKVHPCVACRAALAPAHMDRARERAAALAPSLALGAVLRALGGAEGRTR
ncbi:MAG: radical SAM protein [Thermoanaerobaculum sp.]